MPKGFSTSKEKAEKIIALANTTMTQKQIASDCGVSERTVSRIWERAGIQRPQTPQHVPDGVTSYRQLARAARYDQHIGEVCELAERLCSRLVIPHPIDLYTDFKQRVPAQGWYWDLGKGEIRFPEEDNNPPLFASLKQHTETMSFWQGYVRLKEAWAEFGTQCQRLLTAIKVEAQRLTTGYNWTKSFDQVGITESFAVSAYYDAVYGMQGGAGLTQLYVQDGETLSFANFTIAYTPRDRHPVLQKSHEELRNTFARHQLTRDVVATYQKLTQEANQLRMELVPAKVRKLVLEETSRCDDCP